MPLRTQCLLRMLAVYTLLAISSTVLAQDLPLLVSEPGGSAKPSDPGKEVVKSSSSSSSSSKTSNAQQGSSTKAAQVKASSSGGSDSDSKDTSKIKLTLARMPYEQLMCEDPSEVSNGATLNVSWTRYAILLPFKAR